MSPYYVAMINSPGLCHYGVKGTHWGVRNYQYEDGSYKPGAEGRYAPKGIGAWRQRRREGRADKLSKRHGWNSERRQQYLDDSKKFGKRGALRIQKRITKYQKAGQKVGGKAGVASDKRLHGEAANREASRAAIGKAVKGVGAGLALGFAFKNRKAISRGVKVASSMAKGFNGMRKSLGVSNKQMAKIIAKGVAGSAGRKAKRVGSAIKSGASRLGNTSAGRKIKSGTSGIRSKVKGYAQSGAQRVRNMETNAKQARKYRARTARYR